MLSKNGDRTASKSTESRGAIYAARKGIRELDPIHVWLREKLKLEHVFITNLLPRATDLRRFINQDFQEIDINFLDQFKKLIGRSI